MWNTPAWSFENLSVGHLKTNSIMDAISVDAGITISKWQPLFRHKQQQVRERRKWHTWRRYYQLYRILIKYCSDDWWFKHRSCGVKIFIWNQIFNHWRGRIIIFELCKGKKIQSQKIFKKEEHRWESEVKEMGLQQRRIQTIEIFAESHKKTRPTATNTHWIQGRVPSFF